MTELRAPGHDPIPIGEVVKAPFARLPDPLAMFAGRSRRLRALAEGHTLRPYLLVSRRIERRPASAATWPS